METREIVKELVESLGQNISILSNTVDNDLITLELSTSAWIMEGMRLEIGSNNYKVQSVSGKTIVVKMLVANTPILASTFFLNAPRFFAGTYKMIKQEVNRYVKKQEINPMIWLREAFDDNFDGDPESAIDRTSDLLIYFVGAADYKNWLTDHHYSKVLDRMKIAVNQFVQTAKNTRYFTDVTSFNTADLVNISVGRQQEEAIFDMNLSGIELRFFAEIRKDLSCVGKTIAPKVKDDFQLLGISKSIATGGSIVLTIEEVTIQLGLRAISFVSFEENPNFTFTLNANKTQVTISATGMASPPVNILYKATNGYFTKSAYLTLEVTGGAPSGIQYASYEELWSGQKISYVTGDEGWLYQNGHFQSHILTNPEKVMLLDPSDRTGMTLVPDNIFGNKNRYTAPDGTQNYVGFAVQSYPQNMAMFIDHYYGMAIVCYFNATLGGTHSYSSNFEASRLAGLLIDEQGFNSFNVMSLGEMQTMMDYSIAESYKVNPFNWSVGTGLVATSTPYYQNTDRPLTILRGGIISQFSNTDFTVNRIYFFAKNIQSQLQP